MEITFLGTSSAVPSKYRNHAGIILKYFKDTILFDCGEGTQRQLTYAKISPMKIDKIFITHFHGDHILGLAGLIQSMGFRGREEDLDIYGPKGLGKIIYTISNYGYFQINFNINIHEIRLINITAVSICSKHFINVICGKANTVKAIPKIVVHFIF